MTDINHDTKFYDPIEVAEMLKVHRRTVYRYLRTGKLKGYKVGTQWRVAPDDLEAFIKG